MLKAAGGGRLSFYFLFRSEREPEKMLHARERLPRVRGARRAAGATGPEIRLGIAGFAQQAAGSRLSLQAGLPSLFLALQPAAVLGRGLLGSCTQAWLRSHGENLLRRIPAPGVPISSVCGGDPEFLLLAGVSVCETGAEALGSFI